MHSLKVFTIVCNAPDSSHVKKLDGTAAFGLTGRLLSRYVDLRVVVIDHYGAAVQADHHPWLGGVQVHALHPVRGGRQLLSDVKAQRL